MTPKELQLVGASMEDPDTFLWKARARQLQPRVDALEKELAVAQGKLADIRKWALKHAPTGTPRGPVQEFWAELGAIMEREP